ncbi:MAG: hypothetical protein N2C14_30910 [Planctomycetales bacterium]
MAPTSSGQPTAEHAHHSGGVAETLEFLKRMRSELRTLRKVRAWTDRLQIFDVNGDYFEVSGLGYPDEDVVVVLQTVNAVFKPESIHNPLDRPYKEFKAGKRYPWARDRVM